MERPKAARTGSAGATGVIDAGAAGAAERSHRDLRLGADDSPLGVGSLCQRERRLRPRSSLVPFELSATFSLLPFAFVPSPLLTAS